MRRDQAGASRARDRAVPDRRRRHPARRGFHSRLSDLLNGEGVQFIPLIDATISSRNGEEPEHRDFIAVARDHVQVAYEAQE